MICFSDGTHWTVNEKPLESLVLLIYADFIKQWAEDQGAGDRKYTNVVNAWNSIVIEGSNSHINKIVNLLLTDKEIGRRQAKWKRLAELAADGWVESAGELGKRDGDKFDQTDADDIETGLGELEAEGFKTAGELDEEIEDDGLSEQEIKDREKFYKQCALMLSAHTLKDRLLRRLRTETVPFGGRFWMAKCQKDQERLIGNLVAAEDGARFF